MSTVTLNLQDAIASPTSSMTLSTRLPNNAPLVKITLTPENTGRSELSSASTSTSSLSSPCTRIITPISTFLAASTQAAVIQRCSANLSQHPLVTSLNTSSGNSTPANKQQIQATLTSSVKARQNYETSREEESESSSTSVAIAALQKQLESKARENLELRDKLQREAAKNQMVLSENLQIREELKKVQQKLRQYEQLNNMRQRKSSLAPQAHLRVSTLQRSSHHHSHHQTSNKQTNTSAAAQNVSCESPFEFQGNHIVFQEQQHDQLSQMSILDILENLNKQDDTFVQMRDNRRQSFVNIDNDNDGDDRINTNSCSGSGNKNNARKQYTHFTPKAFKRFDAFKSTKKSFI